MQQYESYKKLPIYVDFLHFYWNNMFGEKYEKK